MKSKIAFGDEKLERAFYQLQVSKTEDQVLYKQLVAAFEKIEANAFSGVHIKKELVPRVFIAKYGIDNLWKYNLPKGWRLLYSVGQKEAIIISIILEWLPHKEYEREFGY